MPYQHFFDSEDFDDDGDESSERPSGAFDYDPAEGHFHSRGFDGVVAKIYAALIQAGATRMRVTYDGGSDEGFSHADDVWFGAERVSCEQAIDRLTSPEVISQLRKEAANPHSSYWGNAQGMYNRENPVPLALDELAHALASTLLGDGFGTGEYELYGALVADFSTGELTDDPSAMRPPNI